MVIAQNRQQECSIVRARLYLCSLRFYQSSIYFIRHITHDIPFFCKHCSNLRFCIPASFCDGISESKKIDGEKKQSHLIVWHYGNCQFVYAFNSNFPGGKRDLFFKFARILLGVLVLGYIGSIITALVHSYIKATSEERTESGLGLILFCSILGFAPSVISGIIRNLAPEITLPGNEFYILAVVLIPISLALAITRRHEVSAASVK